MPPRKPKDPTKTIDSKIVSALRLLFLRSAERSTAIKRDKNICQLCGSKGSVAKGKEVKIEIHHTQEGDINWVKIVSVIREELLCSPDMMQALCKPCHYTHHGRTVPKERKKRK
jgi:5-methylcytosine-specific restriction endonuclease McrA